jgi:hypothetical protein
MMRVIAVAAILLLAGCRDEVTIAPVIDESNPIEAAARDANLVTDAGATAPTGLFERRHAAGTDSICFLPEGDGDDYRFALRASFGTTLTCEGAGSARHGGDKISFDFADGGCAFSATYDGNSVRLPGTVPEGCAAYCGPRASMSGVAVERVGWSEADARRQCG